MIPIEAIAMSPAFALTNLSNTQNKSIGKTINGMIIKNCVALVPCILEKPLFSKSILFLLKEPAYKRNKELNPILNIAPAVIIKKISKP